MLSKICINIWHHLAMMSCIMWLYWLLVYLKLESDIWHVWDHFMNSMMGVFFPKWNLKCVMLFTANVLYCMDLTWYNRLIQRIKPKNSNEVILTVTFDKQRFTLCEHRPGWIWRKSITTNNIQSRQLIHWGRDKMDNTLQTTFSNAFAWMKIVVFWLKFHWNLFLWAQLTIFKHWFGWWLGAGLMTSHYLNQWWMA